VRTEHRQLVATYYDTDDLRLARWGCSVRERNDAGWVVKLPVPDSATDEGTVRDEVGFDADGHEPPHAAVQLVAPLARSKPLSAVARMETDRTAHVFVADDGIALCELTDDRVWVKPAGADVRRFRELELELLTDDREVDVGPLVEHLESSGFHPAAASSKLVRGLGDRAAAPPPVTVPEVSDWPTGREVAHAAIAGAVARLMLFLPHARLGAERGVHQARVATRRLRSDLKTFRDLLEPVWAEQQLDELKWLGGLLGNVRDDDVLLKLLGRLPDGDALLPVFRQHRNTHRSELLRGLEEQRAIELLDRLAAAAQDPPTTPQADDPAPDLLRPRIRKRWNDLRRGVKALGADPADAELHQVRILAKRCRYALEAVVPAFGAEARSRAKLIADLQDALGDLNDLAVIGTRLRHTHTLSAEEAFAAGHVVGQLEARAQHDREAWRPIWRQVADKKHWQWL
jgi:CHAD domain-containing protein